MQTSGVFVCVCVWEVCCILLIKYNTLVPIDKALTGMDDLKWILTSAFLSDNTMASCFRWVIDLQKCDQEQIIEHMNVEEQDETQ